MLINGRAGKFPIFAVSSLADFFNRKLQSANFLLRQMTENYILNVNEIELIDNLSHRYTMTPLVIDFDKVTIQGHQRQISEADSLSIAPLVTNEVFNKASYYSVYVVTYFLPFSGPIELFELAPSKRGFWIQEVFLESPRLKLNHLPQTEKLLIEIEEKCARDGEFLCFDILNLNHDAPAINKEVEQII